MNKLIIVLENQDWYKALIQESEAIIVESGFNSRWALIEGYWRLGQRILEEKKNFEKASIQVKEITSRVSQSLGKSKRTIERAIQFHKKFPDLNKLPDGKSISWHHVVNKYLPEQKDNQKKVDICKHCLIHCK